MVQVSHSSTTRPTRPPPQTLRQAKAAYNKHGPRLSSQEARRIARGGELWERAEKIKEKERKRKEAKKRRDERETREREARHRMGIATQKPCVSQHQPLVTSFFGAEQQGKKRKVDLDGIRAGHEGEGNEDALQAKGVGEHSGAEEQTANVTADDSWDDGIEDEDLLSDMGVEKIADAELVVQGHLSAPRREQEKNPLEPPLAAPCHDEHWADFFASNTQVEREIAFATQASLPYPLQSRERPPSPRHSPFLCTQDVSLDLDDMVELGLSERSFDDPEAARLPPPASTRKPYRGPAYEQPFRPSRYKPPDSQPSNQLESQTNSSSAQNKTDRSLMPPPLLPRRMPLPATSFSDGRSAQTPRDMSRNAAFQPASSLMASDAVDFCLSTQDVSDTDF